MSLGALAYETYRMTFGENAQKDVPHWWQLSDERRKQWEDASEQAIENCRRYTSTASWEFSGSL